MSTVHHQEYLNTVYTQYVFVMLVLLVSASEVRMEFHPDLAIRRQQNLHDKYVLRVYSVEILLMMENGYVRNTWSIFFIK